MMLLDSESRADSEDGFAHCTAREGDQEHYWYVQQEEGGDHGFALANWRRRWQKTQGLREGGVSQLLLDSVAT